MLLTKEQNQNYPCHLIWGLFKVRLTNVLITNALYQRTNMWQCSVLL